MKYFKMNKLFFPSSSGTVYISPKTLWTFNARPGGRVYSLFNGSFTTVCTIPDPAGYRSTIGKYVPGGDVEIIGIYPYYCVRGGKQVWLDEDGYFYKNPRNLIKQLTPPLPPVLWKFKCVNCSKEFDAKNYRQVFCDKKCRDIHYARRYVGYKMSMDDLTIAMDDGMNFKYNEDVKLIRTPGFVPRFTEPGEINAYRKTKARLRRRRR